MQLVRTARLSSPVTEVTEGFAVVAAVVVCR
jgi:hypothetical protein